MDIFNKTQITVIFVMILGCATVSCNNSGNKSEYQETINKEAGNKEDTVLSTTTVTEGFISDELILNGNVTCDENKVSKVFIPCSGKIQNVSVETGDHVCRGQILASVFSQDAANYEKQLSDANAEIRMAMRELSMKKDLKESGMATDKDIEEAYSRLDMAQAEKRRLQNVAHVNNFSNKSHAGIQSPISGYVFAKNVYNGSYVDDSSNDVPAFEIADLSSVWVVADVYESDIQKIKRGAKVYVTVLAYPDKALYGNIDKIYRNLDSESKTMKVRVKIDNRKEMLMPGMFANVHVILSGSGKQMMQVPAKSIVFENGNNYVVVADKNGKFHRQEVVVDNQNERYAYIKSGVSVGDHVVDKNAILKYNTLK